jgi:hypothetical protein
MLLGFTCTRAGRINRYGKLGNNGEGLVKVILPEGDPPYDPKMLKNSIELILQKAEIKINPKTGSQKWIIKKIISSFKISFRM